MMIRGEMIMKYILVETDKMPAIKETEDILP